MEKRQRRPDYSARKDETIMTTKNVDSESIGDLKLPNICQPDIAQPTLVVSNTNNFTYVINDAGSHASKDVTIWRPTPDSPDFFIIGDYAQPNYNAPSGTAYIVKALNDDPNHPLLVPPKSFSFVWQHEDGSGDTQMTLWQPIAPDNYVAIGCVAWLRDSGQPTPASFPSYRCVRLDLVESTGIVGEIWNDHGTKSRWDGSIWSIASVPNAFVAVQSYDPPNYAYKLKARSF